MKISLISIASVFLFFFYSNTISAQFTKEDIEQIIINYNVKEYNHIRISISSAEKIIREKKYFGTLFTKEISFEFEENYFILDDGQENRFFIPYNKIKAISSSPKEDNGYYKHISIFLID